MTTAITLRECLRLLYVVSLWWVWCEPMTTASNPGKKTVVPKYVPAREPNRDEKRAAKSAARPRLKRLEKTHARMLGQLAVAFLGRGFISMVTA